MEATWIFFYALVLARVASFWAMLPMIGDGDLLPPFTKGVLCIALLPMMVPLQMVGSVHLELNLNYLLLLCKEIGIGLLLGFLVSLPLRLPEMIGDIIDNQRGAAVTDQYNPFSGAQTSLLGQLLMLTMLTYFLSEGGMRFLITTLSGSFVLQPPTTLGFGFGAEPFDLFKTVIAQYFKLFAILATPVMIAMFMAEMALGMASRFAQTLNAFQLAQPIKAAIGLSMVMLMQPKIISALTVWMEQIAGNFHG